MAISPLPIDEKAMGLEALSLTATGTSESAKEACARGTCGTR